LPAHFSSLGFPASQGAEATFLTISKQVIVAISQPEYRPVPWQSTPPGLNPERPGTTRRILCQELPVPSRGCDAVLGQLPSICRGRDTGCPVPPSQVPAGGIPAPGSSIQLALAKPRSPNRAAANATFIAAISAPSSMARASTNTPRKVSSGVAGRPPTTSNRAPRVPTSTPPSGLWPSNGSASSGAAGRTTNLKRRKSTKPHCAKPTAPWWAC